MGSVGLAPAAQSPSSRFSIGRAVLGQRPPSVEPRAPCVSAQGRDARAEAAHGFRRATAASPGAQRVRAAPLSLLSQRLTLLQLLGKNHQISTFSLCPSSSSAQHSGCSLRVSVSPTGVQIPGGSRSIHAANCYILRI